MARTLSRTFGQSRPRVIKDRRLRSTYVRAAAIDVPNAMPDELEAQPDDEHSSMYAQFDELLKGTVTTFKAGTDVRGTVVDVSRKGAFIDIGGKGAAFAATPNLCIAPIVDVRSSPPCMLLFERYFGLQLTRFVAMCSAGLSGTAARAACGQLFHHELEAC